MKAIYTVSAIIGLACVILAIYLFWPSHFVGTSMNSTLSILHNDDESYVFAANDFAGYTSSRIRLIFKGFLGYAFPPDDKTSVLYIAHLDSHKISTFKQTNFAYGGNMFIYKGQLHYENTTNDGQTITTWKWDGNTFNALGAKEGQQILDSFDLFTNLLAKEHWEEMRLTLHSYGTNTAIKLKNCRYNVSFTPANTGTGSDKVIVERVDNKPQRLELMNITNEFRSITREDYLRVFKLAE